MKLFTVDFIKAFIDIKLNKLISNVTRKVFSVMFLGFEFASNHNKI